MIRLNGSRRTSHHATTRHDETGLGALSNNQRQGLDVVARSVIDGQIQALPHDRYETGEPQRVRNPDGSDDVCRTRRTRRGVEVSQVGDLAALTRHESSRETWLGSRTIATLAS